MTKKKAKKKAKKKPLKAKEILQKAMGVAGYTTYPVRPHPRGKAYLAVRWWNGSLISFWTNVLIAAHELSPNTDIKDIANTIADYVDARGGDMWWPSVVYKKAEKHTCPTCGTSLKSESLRSRSR